MSTSEISHKTSADYMERQTASRAKGFVESGGSSVSKEKTKNKLLKSLVVAAGKLKGSKVESPAMHNLDPQDKLLKYVMKLREYRMYKSLSQQRYSSETISRIIYELFSQQLASFIYEPSQAKVLCMQLATEVKKIMLKLGLEPRYKIISFFTIGQIQNQGVKICSRCLWNERLDNHGSCVWRGNEIFAVSYFYTIYVE